MEKLLNKIIDSKVRITLSFLKKKGHHTSLLQRDDYEQILNFCKILNCSEKQSEYAELERFILKKITNIKKSRRESDKKNLLHELWSNFKHMIYK